GLASGGPFFLRDLAQFVEGGSYRAVATEVLDSQRFDATQVLEFGKILGRVLAKLFDLFFKAHARTIDGGQRETIFNGFARRKTKRATCSVARPKSVLEARYAVFASRAFLAVATSSLNAFVSTT